MSSSSSIDRVVGARRVLLINLARQATKQVNFAASEIGRAKVKKLLRRWSDRRKGRSSPSQDSHIGDEV